MRSFDPIFVLPVAPAPTAIAENMSGPGRRTGTGSAAINKSGTMQRTAITGFHRVSLVKILSSLGTTPSTNGLPLEGAKPLEAIIKTADRPVVVFPECTTSNGRGLLRFADVFDPATPIPVKAFRVFVMCARYAIFSVAVLRPINGASAFQIRRTDTLETHRNVFNTQLIPNSDP